MAMNSTVAADESEVRSIPRVLIRANPHQHRKHFDDDALNELAQSIAAKGILQNLVVRPVGNRFEIVAGERRYRAAAIAGIEQLPCRVLELSDAEAYRMSLCENVQRADISPLEEADAYATLREVYRMTPADIARDISKSASYIQARLSLAALSADVRSLIEQNLLGVAQGQEVARVTIPADQFRLAQIVVQKRLTKVQAAHLVRAYFQGGNKATQAILLETNGLTEEEQTHWNGFLRALADIARMLHTWCGAKHQVIARKVPVSDLRADLYGVRNLAKWLTDVGDGMEQEIARRELGA